MTEENDPIDHEEEFEYEKPRWLGAMKMLVLGAGLLLLGGILLFSGVFFTKAQNYSKHMDAQLEGDNPEARGLCAAYAGELSLGGRGAVVGIQLTSTLAHATLQQENGDLILLSLDRCSGEVVAQQALLVSDQPMLLEPEAPSAPSPLPWNSEPQ